MLHIEEHNFEYALGRKTYSLGMNHYGDMTSDEFAKTYNGFLNSKKEMLPWKNQWILTENVIKFGFLR